VHSLRVELQRRGLSTRGVKSALLARLAAALAVPRAAPVSVPARFPRRGVLAAAARRRAAEAAEVERAAKRARLDVVGVIVAGSVWVCGAEEMDAVWGVADGYGKGSLSRSEPLYGGGGRGAAKSGRAARQLLELEKAGGLGDGREGVEHLQMTFVEAFHAAFVARRIRLVDCDGRRLDEEMAVWRLFCGDDPLFAQVYAAYVRYRLAGWMPRSGLKYGVDWVLYRAGTKRHSHSPYCLILEFGGAPLQPSWIRLQNKLRLVKNVAKNLVAASISMDVPDPSLPDSPQAAVDAVTVTELTIDRWVS
jgi:tRNA splicing endonuclease